MELLHILKIIGIVILVLIVLAPFAYFTIGLLSGAEDNTYGMDGPATGGLEAMSRERQAIIRGERDWKNHG